MRSGPRVSGVVVAPGHRSWVVHPVDGRLFRLEELAGLIGSDDLQLLWASHSRHFMVFCDDTAVPDTALFNETASQLRRYCDDAGDLPVYGPAVILSAE